MEFINFKTAVAARFNEMAKTGLFRVEVTKNDLWDVYLASFPAGSDPIYRERTQHNCNCCKQFIRSVGDAVTIIDNKVVSIWDVTIPGEPEYQAVADALSALVHSRPVVNKFLHYENKAGTEKSYEALTDGVHTWNHFFVNIPNGRNRQRNYVMQKSGIDTALGTARSTYDVLFRGLSELSNEAVDTVIELISQNSLYRGQEFDFAVKEFGKLKRKFDSLPESDRNAYVWSLVDSAVPESVLRFRNTVIGTLATDLSNDVGLEDAVRIYESKVAPTNYKRPTALVTKDMVKRARATLDELGLTSALERRYANITDITVNNILFADRAAKKAMTGDVFDEVIESAGSKKKQTFDKVEEVGVDKFVTDILPLAETVEIYLENSHSANLVTLVAPVDPTAGSLFKWNNNFSWAYAGDVTDSIKERVKKAGGNVTGDLCCRLAWYNHDDLDFHMLEPDGSHIYFGTRGSTSPSGGRLDVDMNAGSGTTREPVENIFYSSSAKMKPGTYKLQVHNFCKRESTNVGFEVEMDFKGDVYNFARKTAVPSRDYVTVAEFDISRDKGMTMTKSMPSTKAERVMWNINTQNFHRVTSVMLSPNHWDENGVGNKHYFFMIDGCKNDETVRGFYNEFLKSDLDKHRKVLEMVGSKVRTSESDNQLSGVGFSSTQRNSVICRVKGKFTRVIKVLF